MLLVFLMCARICGGYEHRVEHVRALTSQPWMKWSRWNLFYVNLSVWSVFIFQIICKKLFDTWLSWSENRIFRIHLLLVVWLKCLQKIYFYSNSLKGNLAYLSFQQSLDYRESHEAEPHPLWEYPCRALTASAAVMTFDFTQCLPQMPIISQGSLPFTRLSSFFFYWVESDTVMFIVNVDDIDVSAQLLKHQ